MTIARRRRGWLALGLAVGLAASGSAYASDRELQAVLDRNACVPARIVSTELSSKLEVYEVTCRGPGRVLQVICLETDCRLQTRSREQDDEEPGR
ncbi:MAG: hypothetical protein ACT4O6_18165 [Reyranella sp.]